MLLKRLTYFTVGSYLRIEKKNGKKLLIVIFLKRQSINRSFINICTFLAFIVLCATINECAAKNTIQN